MALLTFRHCVFSLISILVVPPTVTNAADWPEFRGPTGDGYVAAATDNVASKPLPLEWGETKNVRWKSEVPHHGWSTPVVMDGQVWLTTATEDGDDFYALCFDAETGRVVHNVSVFHCDKPAAPNNSLKCYAACSPAIEQGRVYIHFGSYGTACLDTNTGKVLWKRDDLKCLHYLPCSSVVLFEKLVILTMDGADHQYVIALDQATGETIWKRDRDVKWNDQNMAGEHTKNADPAEEGDYRKGHSTPLVVNVKGKVLLVSGGAKAAFGYDPYTGNEIWRVHYDDWSVAPRPIYHDGITYIVTGLSHPELWAVKADGTGDLTDTGVLWRLKSGIPGCASPLLVDGLIYLANDAGVAICVDSETGDVVWKKRIGGRYCASPIYSPGNATSDSRIYFCNDEGATTVVKPGRKYQELAKNTLDDGFMASPAAADGALFLRTKSHLYRVDETQ